MKLVIKLVVILIVFTILTVGGLFFFRGALLKMGIVGLLEYVLLTDVQLDAIDMDYGNKNFRMEGLEIHNPDGYEMPTAISVGSIVVDVDPESLDDEITHINLIELNKLLVTIEQGKEKKNISQLSENAARLNEDETTGGDSTGSIGISQEKQADSNVHIDVIRITGIEVQIAAPFLELPIRFPLPDINMENLGGEEGTSVSVAIEETLNRLTKDGMKSRFQQLPTAFQESLEKMEQGSQSQSGTDTNEVLQKAGAGLLKKLQEN